MLLCVSVRAGVTFFTHTYPSYGRGKNQKKKIPKNRNKKILNAIIVLIQSVPTDGDRKTRIPITGYRRRQSTSPPNGGHQTMFRECVQVTRPSYFFMLF